MVTNDGRVTRRHLWAGIATIFVLLHVTRGDLAAEEKPEISKDIVVTLLGTGGPEPGLTRFGPATLVQAGGLSLLFDAGRGATVRLYQLGMSSGKGIDAVFLTHYHSDHVGGLPDLWMTGYMFGPFGNRAKPMRLFGPLDGTTAPSGVTKIAKGLAEAFSDDVRIREADEHITAAATRIEAHDFKGDGVVFEEAGVKVTAFSVNHGELIQPSVGYRIDYGARSVTISGDTKPDENLIKHAIGTDLLIHEVFAMSAKLATLPQLKPVADHHTSPEQAGTVFSRVKPKFAVFSHVVALGVNADEIASRTRSNYQGPLAVGEDMMRFTIGDSVTISNWSSELRKYPG